MSYSQCQVPQMRDRPSQSLWPLWGYQMAALSRMMLAATYRRITQLTPNQEQIVLFSVLEAVGDAWTCLSAWVETGKSRDH